ncbi:acyl carrier protein [Paraburkholderia sp. C35]|uniref:acyl carrier protein n=1 Tax=Paraburkholderia sp. C35 TaxID=2126993 RepID=UPI000D69FD6F|nr:acyl carrier protein [Paraburkholderia sp. C35]
MNTILSSSVEERVKAVVAEQMCVSISDVSSEAHLTADFNADSLDLIEMIMAIEDEFGIEITDEESEKLSTVQTLIDCVQRKV